MMNVILSTFPGPNTTFHCTIEHIVRFLNQVYNIMMIYYADEY